MLRTPQCRAATLTISLVAAALAQAVPQAAAAVQNGKLAYASDEYSPGSGLNIYTINADGSGKTRLVSTVAGPTDADPDWFPDGSKLAYYSFRDGNGGLPEIYTMNADGSAQARLVVRLGMRDEAPAVSPDGSRIAFTSDQFGGYDIFVMNANGTGVTRLTSSADWEKNPAWSPDGTRIAYARDDGNDWEVYVMNADGSGQTALTAANADEDNPSWSPDGTRIAFDLGNVNRDVWAMNANGTGRTGLTNSSVSYDSRGPAWSPTGAQIAFESTRNGPDYDIFVMNADGTNVVPVTSNGAADLGASWQKVVVPDAPLAPAPDSPAAEPAADTTAPQIRVRGRRLTRGKPFVRGSVSDGSGISEVQVALRIGKGRHCAWVGGDRLRRSGCEKPRYLTARVAGDSWSIRVTRPALKALRRRAARVRVYARATDAAGNASALAKKRLRLG